MGQIHNDNFIERFKNNRIRKKKAVSTALKTVKSVTPKPILRPVMQLRHITSESEFESESIPETPRDYIPFHQRKFNYAWHDAVEVRPKENVRTPTPTLTLTPQKSESEQYSLISNIYSRLCLKSPDDSPKNTPRKPLKISQSTKAAQPPHPNFTQVSSIISECNQHNT